MTRCPGGSANLTDQPVHLPVTSWSHAGNVQARPLLEAVESRLGMTPNIHAMMAHAPSTLEGVLGLGKSLGKGALSGALREQIALAVADVNRCDSCAAAHTAVGKSHGSGADDQVQAVRDVGYSDAQTIEIFGEVVKNIITCYFNHMNQTTVDFPAVDLP